MDFDRTSRTLGILTGGVIMGGGIIVFYLPDTAESLPIGLLTAQLASIGALLLGVYLVRESYLAIPRMTNVPDVEFHLSTPTPGDDLDEMVYRLTRLRESTIEYREQVHEKVSEVAITVIQQREGCSRDDAIARLTDGSWTEDAVAAAFFTSEGGGGVSSGLLSQLRARFTDDETAYERQLRSTVAAIERQASRTGERAVETVSEEIAGLGMGANAVVNDDDGERISQHTRYRGLFATRHWTGITAFALVALAVGVISAQPAVLLSSVVALGVAGYAKLGSPPQLAALEVDRRLSDETPQPGDEVTVTVTVENTGSRFLTDLRLVDRVPPTMRVVDGSARLGTSLRPGRSATFEYTLVADRGEHTWPVQAIGRDPSGSIEREAFLDVDTGMHCVPRLKTALETPVRMQTSMYSGQVGTEFGGSGLEFHQVRDYQPGDPMRRINWKQFARTGTFTTIDMREERAVRVVLMFDARQAAYVSPSPGEPHAVNRSVEASYHVFASLIEAGHLVGFAAFDTIPLWLGPSTGDHHVERARQMFVGHEAISPLPPNLLEKSGRYVDPMTHIRRQLPQNTQIFLFSPLTENFVYEVARRLDGDGHLVTVVSPDPTATRTVGQRLARLERTARVIRLREHGIRVIDWDADTSLRLELERAVRRW